MFIDKKETMMAALHITGECGGKDARRESRQSGRKYYSWV
jgi:hypothetical protein